MMLLGLTACEATRPSTPPAPTSRPAWFSECTFEGWIEYRSVDDFVVHAYLLKPAGTGPFKLLVYTPGGGKGSQILHQAMMLHRLGRFTPFLEAGYVVLVPAYRGAADFGPDYEAAFDYGGREVDDVVSGARHLLACGLVDGRRIYFSGVSHGAKISVLIAERHRLAAGVAPICGDYDTSSAVAGQRVPGYCEALQPPGRAGVIRESILKQNPGLTGEKILEEARRRDPLLQVDQIACPVFLTTGEQDYVVGHCVAARLKQELIRCGKISMDKLYRGLRTNHGFVYEKTPATAELWQDILSFCEGRLVSQVGSIPLEALRPEYPQPTRPSRR